MLGSRTAEGSTKASLARMQKGTGCNVWGALAGGHDANLWKTLSECTLGYDAFGN